MKENRKTIVLACALALCAGMVQAAIIQTDNSSNDHDAFVGGRTGGDLINAGNATFLGATGTPAFTPSGAFSISGLNDGASSIGGTDGTGKTFYNTPQLPGTITFTLDTSVNVYGYDIDLINSYAGWGGSDATQANQVYDVLVSTVGSASFTPVANVNYSPFASGGAASTLVSLTDSTGIIASGVDQVRFVFGNNPLGAGTVYQEVDVIGIASVPEPGTISLMSISTIGLFLTRRIRRRRQVGASIMPVRKARSCDVFSESHELYEIDGVESASVFSEIVLPRVNEYAALVKSAFSTVDRNVWNYMVATHERRLQRRAAFRTAMKTKSLNCLDAFLAKIIK
ncbi:PEP-CTERM sorting domain-containing protein [Pontiellaceae bacterium B12227]|nr:PEP-CTERM sorting domain-containing protein [Pontiellaceae bacterium B12227]